MTRPRTEAVRQPVVVNAPIERAFAVSTARFGDFKPRSHNLLAVPIAETVRSITQRISAAVSARGCPTTGRRPSA